MARNFGSVSDRLLLLAISFVPVLAWWLLYPGYFGADDAYIHKAVVENWNAGRGWGVNPGKDVNLSTAPAFTFLMAAIDRLPGPLLWKGSLVTQAATVAGCYFAAVTAHRIAGTMSAAYLAAILSATNTTLIRWTGSFMETTIAFCAVILLVLGYYRLVEPETGDDRNYAGHFFLGLGCGLAALFRPELAMLPFLMVLSAAIGPGRFRPTAWVIVFAGAALVAAPYVWFAFSMFGSLLPTSLPAKSNAGLNLLNTEIIRQIGGVVVLSILGAALAVFLGLTGFLRTGSAVTLRRTALLLAIPLSGFAFYYLKTDSLQSPGRYMLPFLATVPILAGVILGRSELPRPLVTAFPALQAAVLVGAMAWVVVPVLSSMQAGYVTSMTRVAAEMLKLCTPGEPVLIAWDLGVVADETDGRCLIADGGRLASPELADLTLPEMLRRTGARYIVESLGSPEATIEEWLAENGIEIKERFHSDFPSHGIGTFDKYFRVRLYEVTKF